MVIFLLPISINAAHDFLNHKHIVCVSKTENHLHEQDIDCNLHLLKQSDFLYTKSTFNLIEKTTLSEIVSSKYIFYKKQLQLSFLLRGPPFLV